MSNRLPARGAIEPPVGEDKGIAPAFGVDDARVVRAIAGEFGLPADTPVDSRQAQLLAEVLLRDEPLDRRQAALMRFGAFTPRRDADWGLGDTPPTEFASPQSSHDPATQPVD